MNDETKIRKIREALLEAFGSNGFTEAWLQQRAIALLIDIEAKPDENAPGGSRPSDPDTSRRAAWVHYPKSGSQRHRALLAIARAGAKGATASEVGGTTGIPGVWKRVSELKRGGWVIVDGGRYAENGHYAEVYKISAKGEVWIGQRESMEYA